MGEKLTREFYTREALVVARELVGKRLVCRSEEGIAAGVIVETEAYPGGEDAASHAFRDRKTRRTAVHFGPGGFAYVFLIYGMHCCFNVVAGKENQPQVVLVRALEPAEGIDLMARRRGVETGRFAALCSGPGKLCAALGIAMADYGADLTGNRLTIEDIGRVRPVDATKRIGVDYAGESAEHLWRFVERGSPYLSRP